MTTTITQFLIEHAALFEQKLAEHLYISGVSLSLALSIGIPLGILIARSPRLKGPLLGIANICQTIPSLALLALLVPLVGIGMKPTVIVLVAYAILPILRNTYTGITEVPQASIESANGLGFTSWQRLWMVELPLALPMIMAGIRTATAMIIGIATIAAFIGAGGLGDFITQGLALNNSALILLGAIPAALLALIIDYILAQIEIYLPKHQRQTIKRVKTRAILFAGALLLFGGFVGRTIYTHWPSESRPTIIIATKDFTEQLILGEMMAQIIEKRTPLKVIRKFNLGATQVIHAAMLKGDVDLYCEYTGTAYLNILKRPFNNESSSHEIYNEVKQEYSDRFNLVWLKPFGFSNSNALAMKKSVANNYGIRTISDLAKQSQEFTIATPHEFRKRADGLPGLTKAYHLKFSNIRAMTPDLTYRAIHGKQVDVIQAFSTDGKIPAYDLVILEDDKQFYPPYQAAPVIRAEILEKYPEIKPALEELAGRIDQAKMQELNREADGG